MRRRYVGDGMREDITLRNTAARTVRCALELAADADFADLFEVKERPGREQAASVRAADAGTGRSPAAAATRDVTALRQSTADGEPRPSRTAR